MMVNYPLLAYIRNYILFLLPLFLFWAVSIIYISDTPYQLIENYGSFSLLGIFGALVANSTGSGGGIIFVPSFTLLGLENDEILGTSILIQCFGMTAGALSWFYNFKKNSALNQQLLDEFLQLQEILKIIILPAVVGVLVAQYLLPEPYFSLQAIFSYFSIVFGVVLLLFTLFFGDSKHEKKIYQYEKYILIIVSLVGAIVTTWISIGIGEWIALCLIFLRFSIFVAVSAAVIISSITVLSAAYYHVVIQPSVVWEIIVFAAPAAIIGGIFAKYITQYLGAVRLKIFFALWIVVTGILME